MARKESNVTLDPSYRLPASIFLLSLPLMILSPWATAIVAFFAAFLTIQTATLRLVFTAEALDIFRGEARIRQFPYKEWLHWEIYFPVVPILFYFRETQSIHFLPILFNASQLQSCLERYVGMAPLASQLGSESPSDTSNLQSGDPKPEASEPEIPKI